MGILHHDDYDREASIAALARKFKQRKRDAITHLIQSEKRARLGGDWPRADALTAIIDDLQTLCSHPETRRLPHAIRTRGQYARHMCWVCRSLLP